MKLRTKETCTLIVVCAATLALAACEKRKTVVFVDTAWNRDYAKNACEIYQRNLNVACIETPEQIATKLKLRFSSSVRQTPACNDVTISYEPLGKNNLKDFEDGWSLSFNVGIDGGAVDYSNSEWQVIDNKTRKSFGEGPLKDAVEAATRICVVATGNGGSVR